MVKQNKRDKSTIYSSIIKNKKYKDLDINGNSISNNIFISNNDSTSNDDSTFNDSISDDNFISDDDSKFSINHKKIESNKLGSNIKIQKSCIIYLCDNSEGKSACKELGVGGNGICIHNRQRKICKDGKDLGIGGGCICDHYRERRRCKDCKKLGIVGGCLFNHNNQKSQY